MFCMYYLHQKSIIVICFIRVRARPEPNEENTKLAYEMHDLLYEDIILIIYQKIQRNILLAHHLMKKNIIWG